MCVLINANRQKTVLQDVIIFNAKLEIREELSKNLQRRKKQIVGLPYQNLTLVCKRNEGLKRCQRKQKIVSVRTVYVRTTVHKFIKIVEYVLANFSV